MAARVHRDDVVEVIAGAHKGARGKVLRVDPEKQRVVVEGVNMVYRHVRKSRRHPQGGRIQKEAPLHLSNVMPVDPKTGKRTRVRFTVNRDERGRVVSKQRVSLAGTVLSDVSRAREEKKVGQR
jgi:large subunit ribosomal protein L24